VKVITSLAIGLALMLPVAASAAQVTYHGSGRGQSVAVVTPYAPNGATYFAGEMNLSLAGAPAEYPTSFIGFCVDLQHSVGANDTYPVDLVPLPDAGLPNSGRIAWLYEYGLPTVVDNTTAAGLQLAIWDVLTDNGDGLQAGAFKSNITGGVATATGTYLAASANQSGSATWLRSPTHPDGRRQDFVGPKPVIPEPATASLMALGALPMVSFLRRRR
jgi:hypothetical protein